MENSTRKKKVEKGVKVSQDLLYLSVRTTPPKGRRGRGKSRGRTRDLRGKNNKKREREGCRDPAQGDRVDARRRKVRSQNPGSTIHLVYQGDTLSCRAGRDGLRKI